MFLFSQRENKLMIHEFIYMQQGDNLSEEAGCEGVREEACLEKTTANAHTDYIYTQPHPPTRP